MSVGYKKNPNCKPIVNVTIDEDLLKRIEEFRFSNRIANRSQAFTELIENGFKHLKTTETEELEYVSFMEARDSLFNGKRVWSHYPNGKRGYYLEDGDLWLCSGEACGKVNGIHISDINNDFGWTIDN